MLRSGQEHSPAEGEPEQTDGRRAELRHKDAGCSWLLLVTRDIAISLGLTGKEK